jgi:hypothetical protein
LRLFENERRNLGLFAWNDTAGVYNLVGTSTPIDNPVDPIARDAGFVGHDGPALPNQAIEQCGLPDVRTSDDGNEWKRGRHELLQG